MDFLRRTFKSRFPLRFSVFFDKTMLSVGDNSVLNKSEIQRFIQKSVYFALLFYNLRFFEIWHKIIIDY